MVSYCQDRPNGCKKHDYDDGIDDKTKSIGVFVDSEEHLWDTKVGNFFD